MSSGAVSLVHLEVPVVIKRSTGHTQDATHRQQPQYKIIEAMARIQALTAQDLKRVDQLGFQGVMRAAYVARRFDAQVRSEGRGGDLFVFDGHTWLAVYVLESWGTAGDPTAWTKLALQQQIDPPQ